MIEKLLKMQSELMEKVPHEMRPGTFNMAVRGVKLIEAVLMLLSAHGHKPWRPTPLGEDHIAERVRRCHVAFSHFITSTPAKEVGSIPDEYYDRRNLISALGVIEESIEYLNSTAYEQRPRKLEEATDILFFYLELVILGNFTWDEVEQEYIRKHAENLERYRKAKEGDYGWDHRDKGGL